MLSPAALKVAVRVAEAGWPSWMPVLVATPEALVVAVVVRLPIVKVIVLFGTGSPTWSRRVALSVGRSLYWPDRSPVYVTVVVRLATVIEDVRSIEPPSLS